MELLKFMEQFPTEESCRLHFKTEREKQGIVCKKCGCATQYWIKSKSQWHCKDCSFRTTLRSGTILQSSKLPFRTWYIAMAFMSYSKKGISASELQRQLGQKRYEPVWRMMHKIREGMGKRDALYQLEGAIEFDEGYFEKATSSKVKLKRGRGSQKQINVAVMAESTPLEDIVTGVKSSQCKYFKMQVVGNHNSAEIDHLVSENFDQKSIVFSDKSTGYVNISDYVETHISVKSDNKATKTTLKWVHIAISNAKRTLLGIYHKIKGKYLQQYLDEFCYKLNRRYFGEKLFNRLVIAMAKMY